MLLKLILMILGLILIPIVGGVFTNALRRYIKQHVQIDMSVTAFCITAWVMLAILTGLLSTIEFFFMPIIHILIYPCG